MGQTFFTVSGEKEEEEGRLKKSTSDSGAGGVEEEKKKLERERHFFRGWNWGRNCEGGQINLPSFDGSFFAPHDSIFTMNP